jgi:hypothetical protein
MSHDDGKLFLWSIIGFGGGIYTFLKGFRQYRKYRLVADTPTIHIRSIPMGLVQIKGQAYAEETLVSPVTHSPCYVFKVDVEQWHSSSQGGGEWEHLATDIQSVKFDLQDESGNVLVDATDAELDLSATAVREVRNHGSTATTFSSTQQAGAGAVAGGPVLDTDLLQYIEQARLRNVGRMVGKGIGMLSQTVHPAHESPASSLLSLLADPGGAGAEGFRNQIMKAMLARKDPTGAITRLALEVWKHPQGSPEFDSALVRLAQQYSRIMPANKQALDPATILTEARQNPQALSMVAMVAGAADPQSDPELERARQTALAIGHGNPVGITGRAVSSATGHYRLKEYCLLPGKTYDITGTCAENPHPRDEHDRNIILKGNNEPTFLISSRTGTEVQSWLWKQSLWMVLGGAALAVICLAIILGKLGLL